MPSKKTQNKNLVELLEDYWRQVVKGIPKRNDGSASPTNLMAPEIKDANSLVFKWKSFGRTLENSVVEVTNMAKAPNPFRHFLGLKRHTKFLLSK